MPSTTVTISREIAELRRSLKAIERRLSNLAPKVRMAVKNSAGSRSGRVGRTLKLSATRRAQLKLQGRYMATIRQLKPKQKAEVRGVLQKKGMQAAIARAQRLMSRIEAA